MNFTINILLKNVMLVNFIIRIKDMVDFKCVYCVQKHFVNSHAKNNH